MGKVLADAFPEARAIFAEVDEALGQRLSTLMFEGPEAELTLTANAQPALMAVSLAVIGVLRAEAGLDLARDAAFVAGHSLGEYSALAAAGALPLAATARLLRLRGEAMQKAVPVGAGAMAALLGAEPAVAAAIAAEAVAPGEVCQVANDNGGGQVVVSGAKAAVERAIEIAKGRGIKRAILLPVSAPFHCAMMQPAAEAMAAALAEAPLRAAGRAARRQCHRGARHRSLGDPRPARRPGHRHRALARVHGLHGRAGCHAFRGMRCRARAVRPGQARGTRRHGRIRGRAGRDRGLQGRRLRRRETPCSI